MTETYGQMVSRLRKARGWTQAELADRSGVKLRTLQDIEADKVSKPHRDNRLGLARALDIPGDKTSEMETWDEDVETILSIIGAYLMTLSPPERIRWLTSEITRRNG